MTERDPPAIHPAARLYAAEHRAGLIDRREFLTRATSLGLGAAAAYALIGVVPASAQAEARDGGTLRVQMEVRPLTDPRRWDWSEIANIGRGWLEWLVEYQPDGSFRGMLLSGWDINDDATEIVLHVRPGVTWNTGEAFTAAHVAHNIARWCDHGVAGNSMASRMAGLIDPATGKIRDGAVRVVDGRTLRLRLDTPNIALIAGMSDYPAAIVHPSYAGGDFSDEQIGTGPYLLETLESGARAVLVRNRNHTWWGEEAQGFGGATLERIAFVDYGTDPAAWAEALEAGEVDMIYESVGEFIEPLNSLGLVRSEAMTANTICIRANQQAEIDGRRPYADIRVRRALQLAVRNETVLELGHAGRGTVAENHHVCPIHPDYAEIPPPRHDPDEALRLMEQAGMAAFEHELISIDDDWRSASTDAVAAQLRDAGIKVTRRIVPGAAYWTGWARFPFSSTNWNQRPLGVQVLALAYRSGAAWNETGYASPAFDALLAEAMAIAPAETRRVVMARIETLLREDGVVIQPYWRSIYRHHTDRVLGAEMHPTFEIRPYRLGLKT